MNIKHYLITDYVFYDTTSCCCYVLIVVMLLLSFNLL